AGNITLGDKYPIMIGHADIHADAHLRSQRGPSVISAATAPAHPGWSPFISGNPAPAVIICIYPTAVMEGGPTPVVVGNPGISVIGHYPMAVCCIRLKTASRIRKPDITIIRVVNPFAVWRQFIVK